ncbi:MAG TPA: hypothetical protein VKK79_21630 [Candidatus Lokiarchaeia archaeon]|nr:hypothetical protein [Candidatus Lokiarchaeia archaeon]
MTFLVFQWDALQTTDQLYLVSQVIISASMLLMMVYLFSMSNKNKAVQSQKHLYMGLGIFVACNAVTQILWTIDRSYVEITSGATSPSSVIFFFNLPFIGGGAFIAYLVLLFLWSFVPVCWPCEKYVRNSKRFPATRINIIAAIAMTVYVFIFPLVFPSVVRDSSLWNVLFGIMIAIIVVGGLGAVLFILIIIGFYTLLAIKGSGFVRKKSAFISIGFILTFVGLALTQVKGGWWSLLSPVTMIIGFLLLAAGYRLQID